MHITDYFKKALYHGADRPAFIDGDITYSYREIDEISTSIAAGILASDLAPDCKVAVYSPNDAMAFACVLGAFKADGIWIPVNARNTVSANVKFLNQVGCDVLFYHGEFDDNVAEMKSGLSSVEKWVRFGSDHSSDGLALDTFMQKNEDLPPIRQANDKIMTIFPTGGTTDFSKGAQWSTLTWETMISSYWMSMPSEEPPVHLVVGPMTHAAGGLAIMMLPGGPTNVIMRKVDPLAIMQAIEKHGITHLYLPPTLIYLMMAHPRVNEFDYSTLKYFVVSAAPIAPEKFQEAMKVFGPVMCQAYGQAEAPMFMSFLSTFDLLQGGDNVTRKRFASCGRPTKSVQMEIMDEEGRLLPVGERGEIVVRGNLIFCGYLNNIEANTKVSTHGWHHTGDVGYRDEDGFFYIVDRAKDMIVTGGFNVYSAEVEQSVLGHESVQDCAVIGVPDSKWGEAVKAVVLLKPGRNVDAQDIIDMVKTDLGSVQAPKSVEFWKDLPRSPAGKVLKREIRKKYWSNSDRLVS